MSSGKNLDLKDTFCSNFVQLLGLSSLRNFNKLLGLFFKITLFNLNRFHEKKKH
jgi:hypothetical protein